MRTDPKRVYPPALPGYSPETKTAGCILAADGRTIQGSFRFERMCQIRAVRPQALRRDRAAGAGLAGGDLMATTSLWHIEGRLKDLIDYVENPEKTAAKAPELQDLYNVFSYVQRPEATQKGEYVTTINCLKETALRQMILTKKRYGKTDGYIAWHGYQSFKPEEVTPQLAHEIGVKLAKEMWGDRFEIIVTTHLDKEHLHCHFCFNSVSFRDGNKYNYSKAERKRMMDISDRLCREYGLSVIEKPHKAPSRPVWLDEKNGKPTRYNVYRADVREAMDFSRTPYYMEEYLRRKGYITDFTGKHWKIRLPQYEHFTRLDTLDARWTPENIRLGRYASFGNRRAYISYPPQMPQELSDWFRPFHKTSHIYKQYLHYSYLLGYLPKHTDYKPTSPYLKEDLRKLDELSQQVRYMSKYGIETFDDLYADREKIRQDMDTLIARRTKLQNRIRRAAPAEKETLRQEKAGITEQITTLRKQLKLNKAIEVRSAKIQEKTDLLYANEYRAKETQQQKKPQRRERDPR